MDIETAANFLVGCILFGIGIILITIVIVTINNLFSKYWKPVNFTLPGMLEPGRFATSEELNKIPPTFDNKTKN